MNKFLLSLGLTLLACLGLVACGEEAPDLSDKELDARLVGTWQMVDYEAENYSSKDKVLVFNADGSCTGFSHPGGRRIFYTEGNRQLYVFVYGKGLKVSDWTYHKFTKSKAIGSIFGV